MVRAEVGDVAPRDVTVASTAEEADHRVALAFSVDVLDDAARRAEESNVELFAHDVIYRLVEEYQEFVAERERAKQDAILDNIARPARFRLLPDHVFRQSDPAVVGVEVLGGTLKRNARVVEFENSEPTRVGQVKGIQEQGEDVEEARMGERVSVAIDGPTAGRQIEEGDTLFSELPEKHAKVIEQELTGDVPADELETLQLYLDRHRKRDPFWGK
jgi:translation initiation factor 5B